MSLLRIIADLLTELDRLSPPPGVEGPKALNVKTVRQVGEYTQEEVVMAQTEIAVMEVDLPDASQAKNVDLQLLQVVMPNAPSYSQNIKLPRDARKVQYIVPEGAEYKLRLGYADDNGARGLQISWGEEVSLTHTDTLTPDAPGPFGEIRMVDEYVEENGGGTPDVPGDDSTTTEAPVVVETTTTVEPVVESTTTPAEVVESTTSDEPVVDPEPPVVSSTTIPPVV